MGFIRVSSIKGLISEDYKTISTLLIFYGKQDRLKNIVDLNKDVQTLYFHSYIL